MQLEAEFTLITQAIKCAPGGVTAYSFDVENLSERAMTVGLDSLGDTRSWIQFGPEQTELELPPRARQRVTVKVAVPSNAQTKRYSFKLRLYDVRTPTRATESATVAVDVAAGPLPPPEPTPGTTNGGGDRWPIIIAASIGFVLIGAIIAWIAWPDGEPVPDLIGKTVAEAEELLAAAGYDPPQVEEQITDELAAGLVVRQRPRPGAERPENLVVDIVIAAAAPVTPRDAERLAARWVEALNSKDVDALVAMAEPPFFMDSEIAVSKDDIRKRYVEMVNLMPSKVTVTRFDSRTVGDFRTARLLDDRDRVISSMRMEEDDLAVAIFIGSEGVLTFFRRAGPRLEMAGFWD